MDADIILLCLTIAASAGGFAWQINGKLSGLEKGLSFRMDGMDQRLNKVETDIHDIRADIRSINEHLRANKPESAAKRGRDES